MAMAELIKNPRRERKALILGRVAVMGIEMGAQVRFQQYDNGDVVVSRQLNDHIQICRVTTDLLEMTTVEIAVLTIIDQLKLGTNGQ